MLILFCFLLPLLGAIEINLAGELTLAEPVVAVIWLFSFRRFLNTWYKIPLVRQILTLGLLWLIAQVGSDIYRGTPSVDYLRGWLKILVLLATYTTFAVIVGGNFKRAAALIAGMMLQPVLKQFIYHIDLPAYKFIYGPLISAGTFGLLGLFGGRSRWPIIFPIGAGILALFLDCRSLAGITLSAAAYYSLLNLGLLREEKGWRARVLLGAVWALFSISLISLYSSLASKGYLTESAQEKFEQQVGESGKFSILSGRNEIYFSVPKIIRSPIIGWGSWANDAEYVAARSEAMGLDPVRAVAETGGLIPTHSHFFGAWLEAGIFGAIFWGYVLFLCLRILASGWLSAFPRLSGLLSFILVLLAWNILFSPFGGERRVNNGLYIWLITLIIASGRDRERWRRFSEKGHFAFLKGSNPRKVGSGER